MWENEDLRGFPRYAPSKPLCNDVGCATNVPTIEYVGLDTGGNPIFKPNTSCGIIPQFLDSSQKPIELLSEETAQQIYKSFENIRKTMEKDFPLAFPTRKVRKHYKPKFTL